MGINMLECNQPMREQRFHVRTVQSRCVSVAAYQDQRGELMMTQHSRLPSCRSIFATGLHYRP